MGIVDPFRTMHLKCTYTIQLSPSMHDFYCLLLRLRSDVAVDGLLTRSHMMWPLDQKNYLKYLHCVLDKIQQYLKPDLR